MNDMHAPAPGVVVPVPAAAEGCEGSNIVATLDDEGSSPVENECNAGSPTISGTLSPNNPLSVFDGKTLNGPWRLSVADAVDGDAGTVNEWCIIATTGTGANLIFSDGFESGNTSAWSNSVNAEMPSAGTTMSYQRSPAEAAV